MTSSTHNEFTNDTGYVALHVANGCSKELEALQAEQDTTGTCLRLCSQSGCTGKGADGECATHCSRIVTQIQSTYGRPPRITHWPILDDRFETWMSDRRLMGYGDFYTGERRNSSPDLWRSLFSMSSRDLCRTVEDPSASIDTRLTAGHVLALIGDPRIDPLKPAMCLVPDGLGFIGLDADDVNKVMERYAGLGLVRQWIEKETPSHRAALRSYRIGKYPVTNCEFRVFLEATQFPELPTSWQFGRYPAERSNHPVFTVSPAAADAYVTWLSSVTGRSFRLPTEAEWEYAASGSDHNEFPWGDSFLADHANTAEEGLLETSPVGAFPKGISPFLAMDMAGNVEEFVANDYQPYPGGPEIIDDLRANDGSYRVARGGSFTRFRDLARTRRRHGRYPRKIYAMGFRLAEDIT